MVNIKIVRDAAGTIKGATYMTEEEVKERFGDAQVISSSYEDFDERNDLQE